ncbi:structural maintenance of chromosomes protein 5 [Ixodes scapularis]|uniref:structural maintenance of chromosomes protein 5 n=1 Tax=Ixodes scapularis TaxID=6945 RepID=UPI001C38314E|nr:structural maintenance of chromosomes protein 5 [Ixodes scapularis]
MAYSKGSIVRIKLKDFMTYTFVELRPGPSLNVVVGTNGSGKSSLVCAICLGLCGTPQMVGRASHVGDYIRNGAQTALIEIELHNPNARNYVIERQIFPSKSAWKLNNIPVPQKAVEAAVAGLHIQVGNLCQFLPQDRVADFVKMSRQELLEGTEKAVGTRDGHLLHARLIQLQHRQAQLESEVRGQRERLDQERQKNAHLDEEVRKLQEHRDVRSRLDVLRQKLAWLDYDSTRQAYEAEKNKLREEERTLKARLEEQDPLKQQLAKMAAHEEGLRRLDKSLKAEAAAALKKVENSLQKLTDLSEQGGAVKRELERKIKDEATRRERIDRCKADIEGFEKELGEAAAESIESKLQEVQSEMQRCNQTLTAISRARQMADAFVRERQRESAALEEEMRRLKDQSNQRMEMLRRRSKDAFSATQWLLKNEGLFAGKIYPPIMTQVEVPDQRDAKYVEAQIPFRDMMAFVAEQPEDLSKFLGLVRDGQGLRINGVVVPAEPLDAFQPRLPLAQIGPLGFRGYIQSMLRAPDAMMRYLCKQYRVHDVPVGDERVENHLSQIKSLGIRRFYTHNQVYSVKTSRYDSSRSSTMTTEITQPSLLTVSVDMSSLNHLEQSRQALSEEIASKSAEVKELSGQERAASSKLEECRTAKKGLMAEAGRQKQLGLLLDQKRQALQSLQRQCLDLDRERAEAAKKQGSLCRTKMVQVASYVQRLQACYQSHRLCVDHRLEMLKVAADRKKLEDALQLALEAHQALESEVRARRESVLSAKREAQRKLRQAQEAIGCPTNISQIPPSVAREFLQLPKSVAEITQQVHAEEAKLSCMLPVDSAVEQEYHRRQQDITQLEGDLGSNEAQLAEVAEEMADVSGRWLPDLERLLERINQGFQRFFQALGCAGQVSLYRGEKAHEYDQYGVNIRVKFRDNERLTELSAAHQSGGERSVATVVYMMALQELTSVPFRCVDEINQGMDSENERRIFEMIMNTALQNSAQYFLLTPKLLPDLPYAENVTMIFITKSENYIPDWKPESLAGRAVGLAALAKRL